MFPDLFWHVGGDEPHFDCWAANPNVTAYQKAHNLNNEQLYGWFEGQYAGLVSKHGKQVVGWEEIQTTASTSPDPKTTVVEVQPHLFIFLAGRGLCPVSSESRGRCPVIQSL